MDGSANFNSLSSGPAALLGLGVFNFLQIKSSHTLISETEGTKLPLSSFRWMLSRGPSLVPVSNSNKTLVHRMNFFFVRDHTA